ncbi:hypothetical protein, partial [Hungatella effluvii]|uniref:hypothetical protein n=1 Tax=Hungatella effluvii TaxID=1096246 RepID=UPI002A80A734
LNEKSCALRIANTLQSHRKGRVNRPGQTGQQVPTGRELRLFFFSLVFSAKNQELCIDIRSFIR